ncbi:MAG: magnesium/cobalt transporter CorA [Chloroflexaceae bacterium]|nr:magnesium/cobalt transporter CorA [Chloroflexaceae bacterium]
MTQVSSQIARLPFEPEENEVEDYFDYYYDEPGSEPGTLSIDPEAEPTQVILINYTPENATRQVVLDPQACNTFLESDSVSWIDIQGLGTEAVLKQLAQVFQIHPLLLEDVVNVPQRPKLENYGQQLLVIARMVLPRPDGIGFESEQVSLILSPKYLLAFQEYPADCFDPVRDRIRTNKGQVRQQKIDYLFYLLLDALIDGFFPVLEDYGERIENLEDSVIRSPNRQTLEEIYEVRRELLALRRAIWPLRSVINAISRGESQLISQETQIYFRDCYDHIIQLLDIIETYRELASSLMDVYMSAMSNKMNEVVNLLTIISTIFIPLTFITGVYGMNFEYIPGLEWKGSYFVFWGAILAIAGGLLFFFWRRGWLSRFYSSRVSTANVPR